MNDILNASKSILDSINTSLLVDLTTPDWYIGKDLQCSEKILFQDIKLLIEQFYNYKPKLNHSLMIHINESITCKACPLNSSIDILVEIFKYIRNRLLSNDLDVIKLSMLLLDFLVKNSGDFKVYLVIGQRKFLKTISVVGRRLYQSQNMIKKSLAVFIFDFIQAWGEAFFNRQDTYPHYYQTYYKLKTVYGIHFPRPDNDPTRVPIFLDFKPRFSSSMYFMNMLDDRSANKFQFLDYSSYESPCYTASEEKTATDITNTEISSIYKCNEKMERDTDWDQYETVSSCKFSYPTVRKSISSERLKISNEIHSSDYDIDFPYSSYPINEHSFYDLNETIEAMPDDLNDSNETVETMSNAKDIESMENFGNVAKCGNSNTERLKFEECIGESFDKGDHSKKMNENEYDRALQVPKLSKKQNTFIPPSSDKQVEVKYFGHQRVVIRK